MAVNLIQPQALTDNSVYGVQQMLYTVDGSSGKDFVDAVTLASYKQAAAIEATAGGYSSVVKARQKKVSELGEVLSELSKAVASLKVKGGKSSDKVTVDNANTIRTICNTYEIKLNWSGDQMTRGDIQKAQTDVQYQMDKEDNNLQQDIVALQSCITKRDNAYSTAAKVIKKTLSAASSTIENIGV